MIFIATNSKRRYKFDSPPRPTGGLPASAQGAPESVAALGAAALMQPLETTSFVPSTEDGKRLYVSNIPEGINAAMVFFC